MTERPNEQTPRIRVLVADDHAVVRMGLVALVNGQPDLEVVAEAEDGGQALALYGTSRPDVVLMDLRMPGVGGESATRAILDAFPEARILVLSSFESEEEIHQVLRAGARGYLVKKMRAEEIPAAIRDVFAGKQVIPPEIARRLAERPARPALTRRELDVLELLAKGLSNKEIARALSLTVGTVKSYVIQILHKLGVDSRTEAAAEAVRSGLVARE